MNKFFRQYLFLPIVLIMISSCVGTIEETGEPETDASGGEIQLASYQGIMSSVAVSDSRVEVSFTAAPGNQDNFIYEIYRDNAKQPVEVRADALRKDSSGLYTFSYSDLDPSTTYSFKVEFYDITLNLRSKAKNPPQNATTLSNQMCDFDGVVDVRNSNGLSALDTINVYWFPARDSGFIVSSEDYDPVQYEIIAISEDDGGVQELNNPSANRIIKTVNERTTFTPISGLEAGKTYHFQVRCAHKGWQNKGYLGNSSTKIGTYSREANNRFLTLKTKSAGGEPAFSGVFTIDNPLKPSDAETKLSINWEPATGGFDKYRIFWKLISAVDEVIPGAIDHAAGEYDVDALAVTDRLGDAQMDEMLLPPGDIPLASCMNDAPATCGVKSNTTPEDVVHLLSALQKYGFYQIKVVACLNAACDANNRISSDARVGRVVPRLVPFNGIATISNPNPASGDEDVVTLNFSSPIISSGAATKLVVRCFQGTSDTSPAIFDSGGAAIDDGAAGADKPECHDLEIETTMPTYAQMALFESLEIKGVEVNTNKSYCFSVHAEIDESANGLNYKNTAEETAVISCVTPEIKAPNLQEFVGRTANYCQYSDIDNSLTVKWILPTGGYHTDFKVFWREFDEYSSDSELNAPINFQKAIAQAVENTPGVYNVATVASPGAQYTINTAISPGKKYTVGVLAYFELNGTPQYSEFNTNTRDCETKFPKVIFDEWTNIISVGPKVDGRYESKISDITGEWETPRIFETLDEYGVPTEVEMDGNTDTPLLLPLRGSVTRFNGVYGKKDAKTTSTDGPHLYSNSGIIRIEFKDILVDHDEGNPSYYDSLNTFHALRENLVTNNPSTYTSTDESPLQPNEDDKTNRKIGYKILRSSDNGESWVDLTISTSKNPFQRISNVGLIYSEPTYYFKKNGRGVVTNERRVVFTDYSVRHFEDDAGITSRGRVYWYKVVPYINGVPLEYKDAASNTHHILRVILPPPNMAFVSRHMANRQACIELDKEAEIRKGPGEYYRCPYNGIGARGGSSKPWSTAETYYDLGGDLLVDRFELGCNFSRGDAEEGSTLSIASDDNDLLSATGRIGLYEDFREDSGINGTDAIKGCFQGNSQREGDVDFYDNSEPTNFSPEQEELSAKQALPGDCFGSENIKTIYTGHHAACNDAEARAENSTRGYSAFYPGAFENDYPNQWRVLGGSGMCRKQLTSTTFNAFPSLPFDNNGKVNTNGDFVINANDNTIENMDPQAAQSEYGAVFYARHKRHDSGRGYWTRTLNRYFAGNDADNGEKRHLTHRSSGSGNVGSGDYRPSACFINLYGVYRGSNAAYEDNVHPRWLSLSEIMGTMYIQNLGRDGSDNIVQVAPPVGAAPNTALTDLYSKTLSEVLGDTTDLYGGDWRSPASATIRAVNEKRITTSMSLARIMTSNASKLPPAEGLSINESSKLCKEYSVEVGYTKSSTFQRDYPANGADPIKKRLPRRKEFVAFAAWPDKYDEASIITIERGSSDQAANDIYYALTRDSSSPTGSKIIDAVDIPVNPGSKGNDIQPLEDSAEEAALNRINTWQSNACVSRGRFTNSAYREPAFMEVDLTKEGTERFKNLHPAFPLDEDGDDPRFWSGSSRLDDSVYNSERCVSRYGIQDAAGNYSEYSAERFWCDPDAHEFKITHTGHGRSLVLKDTGSISTYFRADIFPQYSVSNQYANAGVAFGECSVRSSGNDPADFDPALNGQSMVSIYNDYTKSSIDLGLIPKAASANMFDPGALLSVRNGGDGAFLSFGANELAPPLYHNNASGNSNYSLINGGFSDSGYFNPVLGIPIKCSGATCSTSTDNMVATLDILHNNLRTAEFGTVITEATCADQIANDAGFPVKDCSFPVGNSNITNYSTHELRTQRYNLYKTGIDSSVNNNYGIDYIQDINPDGSALMISDAYPNPDAREYPLVPTSDRVTWDAWVDALILGTDHTDPDFVELVNIIPYDSNGNTAGMFINGGGASTIEDTPGRYALNINMHQSLEQNGYNIGTRCMLMIYGSDY